MEKGSFMRILFLILSVVLFYGCASSVGISAHRLEDLQDGNFWSEYEEFSADEIPAVLIEGFGGRTVLVKLYDLRINHIIREQEFYIKKGTSRWLYWDGLTPGTYRAELIEGDDVLDETRFVLKKTDK